jgi:hypothetical protein
MTMKISLLHVIQREIIPISLFNEMITQSTHRREKKFMQHDVPLIS